MFISVKGSNGKGVDCYFSVNKKGRKSRVRCSELVSMFDCSHVQDEKHYNENVACLHIQLAYQTLQNSPNALLQKDHITSMQKNRPQH